MDIAFIGFHKTQNDERRNVAIRQAPEQPEKRDTLTGYRSQLPHAEIFVTQLIARVWPFAVRVCVCVPVVNFRIYIKTFPSISITIYILCVWLGRRTTKTKMITISTLRFDGLADDTTTWRYFFLLFRMLHVVKAIKNRTEEAGSGDALVTISIEEKSIFRSINKAKRSEEATRDRPQ